MIKGRWVVLTILLVLGAGCAAKINGISRAERDWKVVFLESREDGNTFLVETSGGKEIWRDEGLNHFELNNEMCWVIESFGTRVLVYIPKWDVAYWFTVSKSVGQVAEGSLAK